VNRLSGVTPEPNDDPRVLVSVSQAFDFWSKRLDGGESGKAVFDSDSLRDDEMMVALGTITIVEQIAHRLRPQISKVLRARGYTAEPLDEITSEVDHEGRLVPKPWMLPESVPPLEAVEATLAHYRKQGDQLAVDGAQAWVDVLRAHQSALNRIRELETG
jgi:hypothetical protein